MAVIGVIQKALSPNAFAPFWGFFSGQFQGTPKGLPAVLPPPPPPPQLLKFEMMGPPPPPPQFLTHAQMMGPLLKPRVWCPKRTLSPRVSKQRSATRRVGNESLEHFVSFRGARVRPSPNLMVSHFWLGLVNSPPI